MPSINMIASRRAEKQRQQQNLKKMLYVTMSELGVVLVAISFLVVRQVAVNIHIGELNERLRKIQPKVNEIQKLQQDTAKLMPKVQTLDGARADTLFWYNNLYTISNSLAPKTWLTSLNSTGDYKPGAAPGSSGGDAPTMSIAGMAPDQDQVGQTMLHMNTAPTLDHVDLSFVQSQKTGSHDTVTFQMTVHLKPQATSAPAVVGGRNAQKS